MMCRLYKGLFSAATKTQQLPFIFNGIPGTAASVADLSGAQSWAQFNFLVTPICCSSQSCVSAIWHHHNTVNYTTQRHAMSPVTLRNLPDCTIAAQTCLLWLQRQIWCEHSLRLPVSLTTPVLLHSSLVSRTATIVKRGLFNFCFGHLEALILAVYERKLNFWWSCWSFAPNNHNLNVSM